jgi:hypothetical protein
MQSNSSSHGNLVPGGRHQALDLGRRQVLAQLFPL